MKKVTIIALVACMAMFAVSCKNQPKAEEPAATECCKGDCAKCENKVEEAAKAAAEEVATTAINTAADKAIEAIAK